MKITEWIPKWRHCLTPIEIIEHPSLEWFEAREHTRFAVLEDGRVIWGAGDTIIHGDITRAAPQLGWPKAIGCGVLMRCEGHPWFLCALEAPWGRGTEERANFERLLHRLASWIADTKWLGPVQQGPLEKFERTTRTEEK